jgi:hypothetical protein
MSLTYLCKNHACTTDYLNDSYTELQEYLMNVLAAVNGSRDGAGSIEGVLFFTS